MSIKKTDLLPVSAYILVLIVVWMAVNIHNNYAVTNWYLWPATYLLISFALTGIVLHFIRKKFPFTITANSFKFLGLFLAVAFCWLEGKIFFSLQGFPMGSGEIKGVEYAAYHSYNIGFQDGDWESINIYQTSHIKRAFGIGGDNRDPRITYSITPPQPSCPDPENCEGTTFKKSVTDIQFSDEGATLYFEDGTKSNYSSF